MSAKNKVQRTASSIQQFALTSTLDEAVDLVNTKFNCATLAGIEGKSYYETPTRSYINCALMHIKKKTNEKHHYSKKKDSATKNESTCCRFLVLGDDQGNPLCLIVENDSSKANVLGHFDKTQLGNELKIVSPYFKGYRNNMPVLTCELLLPLSCKPTFQKTITIAGLVDEDCVITRITTRGFVAKQVGIAEHCCKGLCDSRHGNHCYCKSKIGLTGSILTFTIAIKAYDNLRIKSFISLKLTKLLVDDAAIISNFTKDGTSCIFDIETRIIDHFKNKDVTFLLWCKPHKEIENDLFAITKANVTDVEISENVVFPKWKFPTAPTLP